MSNMKNILGDIDFEKFEEKRKTVLNKIKGLNMIEFDKLDCDDTSDLYDCWLEIEGKEFAKRRLDDQYCGYITINQFDEYTQGLLDKFVEWLEKTI